ncbi:uncharacterized protein LAJ45_04642 [Morchella importuna]|uniref:uncharacterized protein n=1 Tax=Morchella importuna TaxID=1174673 RepID=UPI001E8EB9A1|nr:uncharacterized protein LAJ45_04642 [Morchella importuna]KAH8151437.1 hypothetical protein LAJ45_04642 [Morchella importuna]
MAADPGSKLWPLMKRSTIVDYVHHVSVTFIDLENLLDIELESRENCLIIAEEYLITDKRRKNIENLEERDALDLMCEKYMMEFKIWVKVLKQQTDGVERCQERHKLLAPRLMEMTTEDMKKLITEFEAQEDILIDYMETVEMPLLPEGTIYDEYIELRDHVDSWLTRLQYRIEDLEDEIENGVERKNCEEYERVWGRGGEFVMIWLLNRALVFILTLH